MISGRRMLRVGLTGGIACGKSTVARLLEERGCRCIDADAIARELLEPGTEAHGEVIERFGEGVRADGGSIDRTRLGELVFADDEARGDLEAILHPRILAEELRRLEEAERSGAEIAVVEAALMVEAGSWKRYDRLVVVRCQEDLQVRRLMEQRGLDEAGARARIRAQTPVEHKARLADYVVENGGSLRDLRAEVDRLYDALREDLDQI